MISILTLKLTKVQPRSVNRDLFWFSYRTRDFISNSVYWLNMLTYFSLCTHYLYSVTTVYQRIIIKENCWLLGLWINLRGQDISNDNVIRFCQMSFSRLYAPQSNSTFLYCSEMAALFLEEYSWGTRVIKLKIFLWLITTMRLFFILFGLTDHLKLN